MSSRFSRRRFLSLSGVALGLEALSRGSSAAVTALSPTHTIEEWRGRAMGAEANMRLAGFTPGEAQHLFVLARAEIERLENLFSLYRSHSVLSQLNEKGVIDHPPAEFRELVELALVVAKETDGAFDPSVQPLWTLYRDHFSRVSASRGPSEKQITARLQQVDYRRIRCERERITFEKPGMALTLNGIAQGFITDKITRLLSTNGVQHILVNMGEYYGLGHHPGQRPWRVGLRDPQHPQKLNGEIELENAALATSGGYGYYFDAERQHHHLLDPRTGHSSQKYKSISVRHPRAALADAYSTAFMNMEEEAIKSIMAKAPLGQVFLVRSDGTAKWI